MINLRKYSLGTRLGMGQGLLVLVLMGILTTVITVTATRLATHEAEKNLKAQTEAVVDAMVAYDGALTDAANRLTSVLRSRLGTQFAIDNSRSITVGEHQTPLLSADGTTLNLNTAPVDQFTRTTGAVGTVFVRKGDDFIRITTSLLQADGKRAQGTLLDRKHPAHSLLLKGESYVGKATLFGKDYMTKYEPVKDSEGKVQAILFVGMDFTNGLKSLKDRIKNIKIGETGYIFAIDAAPGPSQGTLTMHPAKEGSSILEAKDSSGKQFVKEMIAQKSGIIHYPWINEELGEKSARDKLVAFTHLPEWNWIVAAGSYTKELNALAATIRNTTIIASIIVLVCILAMITVLIRNWVSAPLYKLSEQIEQYADGDFSHATAPAELEPGDADELLLMRHGVSKMAYTLREVLARLTGSANEVVTAAQQVSITSEQIANGADNIAGQTLSVSTAGEEMSATSSDIAQNCQMAAESAQQATQAANNGASVVEETISVMSQIADKVQESARTVESLGSRSDQIGAIIGTIEDIADQTNLLALNAAIEAARAGEMGRGFAVVADEVRALAERTTRATREISDMIKAIQGETKGAVIAMEQGVGQVEAGTREARKSGEALQDILEQIGNVAMQVSQIATAAEEQTATTSEISGSIMQITDVVQTTAAGARESATAATELNATARELQRMVQQFRL
ncbi:MAG: methyl-accepting chemotaxis protein [Trichlorobacter sp.]|nr:methyl-accepting chemotaxis protein [Trichlorobacter sp.]